MKPAIIVLVLAALVAGCINLGDQSYEEVEPGDIPATVTYTEHIYPISASYCLECHSPSGRFGTQEGVNYDGYTRHVSGFNSYLRVTVDEKTMPPGTKPRPTAREIALLLKWKEQGYQQ